MTNANLTLIAALLDRSGSMSLCLDSTKQGFDELIGGQRSEPGECIVTLAQFDRHARQPVLQWNYQARPIADVGPLELWPRGATPMLDAVGQFVIEVGEQLSAMPEDDRPGTVICLIMTDGYENASVEWSWPAVKELITQQTEQWNWTFMFLGANIDAVEVGTRMGVSRGSTITFDSADSDAVVDTYAVASAAMAGTRSGLRTSFSEEDRRRAMGKK